MFGMILLLLFTEPIGAFHYNGAYIFLSIPFPAVTFISLLDHLIDCENNNVGLSFSADVIYLISGPLVSFIVYTLLSIFLDMILPGEFGNAVSPLNALKRIKNWITSVYIYIYTLPSLLILPFSFLSSFFFSFTYYCYYFL